MGTTLSLCWFTPGWMFFAHVGDSRIYYLPRGGELMQVTHDHSQVGWMRRTGRINEREARNHPGRSSLQQALGAGHQVIEPHIGAVGYQPATVSSSVRTASSTACGTTAFPNTSAPTIRFRIWRDILCIRRSKTPAATTPPPW